MTAVWGSGGQLGWSDNAPTYIVTWDHMPQESGPMRVHGTAEQVTEDGTNRVAYAVEFVPAGETRTIRFPNGKLEMTVSELAEGTYFSIASGYSTEGDMPPGMVTIAGGETYYITALKPPPPGGKDDEAKRYEGGESPAKLTLRFHHQGIHDDDDIGICFYSNDTKKWGPTENNLPEGKTISLTTTQLGTYAAMARTSVSLQESLQRLDQTLGTIRDDLDMMRIAMQQKGDGDKPNPYPSVA